MKKPKKLARAKAAMKRKVNAKAILARTGAIYSALPHGFADEHGLRSNQIAAVVLALCEVLNGAVPRQRRKGKAKHG